MVNDLTSMDADEESTDDEVIAVMRLALNAARHALLVPDRTVTDGEGGLALYFFGGSRVAGIGWSLYGAIVIDDCGDVVLCLRDRSADGVEVVPVEPTAQGLAQAMERIRLFTTTSP